MLKLFRIQLHHGILFGNVLVHDWLCEHGIIPFIVTMTTITNLEIFEDTTSTNTLSMWAFLNSKTDRFKNILR